MICNDQGGQEEENQKEILAQELAELLGIVLARYRLGDSGKGDQEAFVVTIHGTQLHLMAANFTEAYLQAVQSS